MIYRVFDPNFGPSLCSCWGVANAVAQDCLQVTGENTVIERDDELAQLRLDMGGAIWTDAEEISIPLGDMQPHFTFWAHQLVQVYDQIRTNHSLVEETGYVRFYGEVFCICLLPTQAWKVWDTLTTNLDMYKILESSSRAKWDSTCIAVNADNPSVRLKTVGETDKEIADQMTDSVWWPSDVFYGDKEDIC